MPCLHDAMVACYPPAPTCWPHHHCLTPPPPEPPLPPSLLLLPPPSSPPLVGWPRPMCPSHLIRCIWYGADEVGLPGIYLGKNVVNEASKALTLALTKVGLAASGLQGRSEVADACVRVWGHSGVQAGALVCGRGGGKGGGDVGQAPVDRACWLLLWPRRSGWRHWERQARVCCMARTFRAGCLSLPALHTAPTQCPRLGWSGMARLPHRHARK